MGTPSFSGEKEDEGQLEEDEEGEGKEDKEERSHMILLDTNWLQAKILIAFAKTRSLLMQTTIIFTSDLIRRA